MRPIVFVPIVLALALLAPLARNQKAAADHADGNMPDHVNYWLVQSGQVEVCNASSNFVNNSVFASGLGIWNDDLQRTILVPGCDSWGIRISDGVTGDCQNPTYGVAIACSDYPHSDSLNYIEVKILSGATGSTTLLTETVAHEIGHALGFCHAPTCDASVHTNTSIMTPKATDASGGDIPTTLQQFDIDNYHWGYHVDAPANIIATSGSAGQVTLTWDATNLHNENGFHVIRQDACGGAWVAALSPDLGPNTSSVVLNSQPAGLQNYQVTPTTSAETAYPSQIVIADVAGFVLSPPNDFTSSLTSAGTNRITWVPVASSYYRIVSTFLSPKTYPTCTTSSISKTQFNVSTLYPNAPYYFRVQACNSAGDCGSLSSEFVQTQHVSDNGWNYNFTYYDQGSYVTVQFANLMPLGYPLALHVTNANTATGPFLTDADDGIEPSPCIGSGTISSLRHYFRASFGSGTGLVLGTVGRTMVPTSGAVPNICDGYNAPSNHSGVLPPP